MNQDTPNQIKNLYPEVSPEGPGKRITHPGKTLTHRFDPDEIPRQIIMDPAFRHVNRIASEVNFNPVTTLHFPNESIYVKPVKNLEPRHMSPLPLKGYLKLPIRGERVFDLSADLQRQIGKRVSAITSRHAKKTRPAPINLTALNVQPPPFSTEAEAVPKPTLLPTKTPPRPSPTPAAPGKPTSPPKPAITTSTPPQTVGVSKAATLVKPPFSPELASQPITQPRSTPPAPVLATPASILAEGQRNSLMALNKVQAQLAQESVQKKATQERIVEVTNAYQSQIALMGQEKAQIMAQLEDVRGKLMAETKRRIASENRITTATNELRTEINKMKIERDGLFGQLKEAQNKLTLSQQQEKSTSANVEITQLKAKLAQVEKEKSDVDQKAIKLESLVNDLRKKSQPPVLAKEVIIPTEASEKTKNVPVKIIHPAPAIGKMAPQLTTIPNVVSGMVKSKEGMLLTNVIIVVKDTVGNPVRALKSNKVGQFAISTPLPNGVYTMELEKGGNEFDVVQVNLEGEVMPPIEIRSR